MSDQQEDVLTGGCLCGQIRYQIRRPFVFVSQCCCKDCQKATGTGHTTIVGLHGSQLTMEGQPRTYSNTGDTGGNVTRHFCGNCGGRLYTTGDRPGEIVIMQAGSLDDPEQVTPENVIYAKDQISWDKTDPALPHVQGLPDRKL